MKPVNVHIYDDPHMGAKRLTFSVPGSFNSAISEFGLYGTPPELVIESTARMVAKALQAEIIKVLMDPENLNTLFGPKVAAEFLDAQNHKAELDKQFINSAPLLSPEQAKKWMHYMDPAVSGPNSFQPGGVIKETGDSVKDVLRRLIPGIEGMAVHECPAGCARNPGWLTSAVIHLNDNHGWTREEIADWLETLDFDLTFKTPEEQAHEH